MQRRTFFTVLGTGCAALLAKRAEASEHAKQAPPDAMGMLYDSTLCIGCKTCVVACREENGLKPEARDGLHDYQTELNGNTKTVIKVYEEQTPNGFVSAFMKQQCMHCIDPACVSACMIGALKKREFGAVTYDKDLCVGCRYCQIACPFDVPKFEFNSAVPKIQKCELCVPRIKAGGQPACTAVCPRQAITFGKRDALLQEAHRRIATSKGKYLDKVYGEHDAGGTQVLYLTAAHVPFEKLGLPKLGTESAPHLSEAVQEGIYQGFITPAVLYGVVGAVVWRNKRVQDKHEHQHEEDGK